MFALSIQRCFTFMKKDSKYNFGNDSLLSKYGHQPIVYNMMYKCLNISSKITTKRWRLLDSVILLTTSAMGVCLYILWQGTISGVKETSEEHSNSKKDYESAITKSRDLLQRVKDVVGAPGIIVGVSVDGTTVWEEGIGYADLENRVLCNPHTVMRIASISKSITMAAVAKLWEDKKLNLDKPIQHYLPEFPVKHFDGKPVQITCRQLVSHVAGIRHYNKNGKSNNLNKGDPESDKKKYNTDGKKKESETPKANEEFELEEYYIKDRYTDIQSALELFKNDALVKKPGAEFFYSTHGYTLVSALVEKTSEEPFCTHMAKLFKKLGMHHTYLDENIPIIYHRSRNYVKGKFGLITNAPYVDNSYKWAGGGFLSTVGDLIKFANVMLYSLQYQSGCSTESADTTDCNTTDFSDKINSKQNKLLTVTPSAGDKLSGYLNSKTIVEMWSPVIPMKTKDMMYAMGWCVLPEKQECQYCGVQQFSVLHTGGAIGASSVLFIMPRTCGKPNSLHCQWPTPPKGVIVAIMTNLQNVSLSKTAAEIATLFRDSE